MIIIRQKEYSKCGEIGKRLAKLDERARMKARADLEGRAMASDEVLGFLKGVAGDVKVRAKEVARKLRRK